MITKLIAHTIHRNKNLVYLLHKKCANTFYSKFFSAIGWGVSSATSISWSNDIVFSHIRKPVYKQRLGLVEDLLQVGTLSIDDMLTNDSLTRTLATSLAYGSHSDTLFSILPDNYRDIKYYPIDTEVDHLCCVVEFLKSHGIAVSEEIVGQFRGVKFNETLGKKKQLVRKMLRVPLTYHQLRYLDADVCLYNDVVQGSCRS